MAACTSASVWLSKELVASSKHIIFAYLRSALAIDILCFSPPESLSPLSPTFSRYYLGFDQIKSWILAFFEYGIIISINLSISS